MHFSYRYAFVGALSALFFSVGPLCAAELRQSPPVKMNNAEFVLVAQDEWVAGQPAEMEFRIKNLSQAKLTFPVSDNIKLELSDSKGMAVRCPGGGSKLTEVKPLALNPGETGVVKFKTDVTADGGELRTRFTDERGMTYVSAPVSNNSSLRVHAAYSNSKSAGGAGMKYWTGDALTEDLVFKVSDGSGPPKLIDELKEGAGSPGFQQ